MKVVIGIDLGTSQSAGCYAAGGQYRVVENEMVRAGIVSRENNEKYHPSYVHYSTSGEAVAMGIRAKMLADMSPRTTVYDSKRLIGRPYDDPEVHRYRGILAERGHYEICKDGGEARIRIGDRLISPEDAGAEIVCGILKDALEQDPSIEVARIVISVPAYYDNVQKARTKQAAILALGKMKRTALASRIFIDPEDVSLDEDRYLSLIPEPSAAFITYMDRCGLQGLEAGSHIMVFDMGAGTLDITIGALGAGKTFRDPMTRKERYTLDIERIHGNRALGGRDMDQLIIEHLRSALASRGLAIDSRLTGQVREQAEKAKIELSASQKAGVFFLDHGITMALDRQQLEGLIEPVLVQCRQEILDTLGPTGIGKGGLAAVVLVGGPTLMPCVRRLVEEETGIRIKDVPGWDPMLCVAEGAARLDSTVVNERLTYDYYVAAEMFDGVFLGEKVASAGDPANLELQISILVPYQRIAGVGEVRLCMAEGEELATGRSRLTCIQKIMLPVASALSHGSDIRWVSDPWKTADLRPHLRREIDFHYGRMDMRLRITSDGLMVRPEFFDKATGVKVLYPTLPVRNFGEIDMVSQGEFDRRWNEFAKDYLDEVESNTNRVINSIGRIEGCDRREAIRRYLRNDDVRASDDQVGGLKAEANDLIAKLEAAEVPESGLLIKQLEAAVIEAGFDSICNRYRLQAAIAAARTALDVHGKQSHKLE
jgi:8-oxo-dGTP pyrophosphatase MutT (NUDIX family)